MAGYNYNNGMSNNAVAAYNNGEMPLSKWTKSEILKQSIEAIDNENYYKFDKTEAIKILKSLKLKKLRETLENSSYHHTGKYYNITEFYRVNIDYILNFLNNEFNFSYDWNK